MYAASSTSIATAYARTTAGIRRHKTTVSTSANPNSGSNTKIDFSGSNSGPSSPECTPP